MTIEWIPFPDARVTLHGLAWPEGQRLRRFPETVRERLPARVWELAQFPGGGRIRLRTDSGALHVRFTGTRPSARPIRSGLDAYVDGSYWNSVITPDDGEREAAFFAGAERTPREITIYLPLFQTVELHAVGVERGAVVEAPVPFPRAPWLLYGSSIAQGSGAARPAMTYPAILSRSLNLDFYNFGFGGAGKAEPEVVDLIAGVEASAFVLDLGKSYGLQGAQPYADMLAAVRRAQPAAPQVCLTPIHATHEAFDADYRALSEHTRQVVRQAVDLRWQAGDTDVHLVEGKALLGPADADAYIEGVHPTDLGFARIADRLQPILAPLLTR